MYLNPLQTLFGEWYKWKLAQNIVGLLFTLSLSFRARAPPPCWSRSVGEPHSVLLLQLLRTSWGWHGTASSCGRWGQSGDKWLIRI